MSNLSLQPKTKGPSATEIAEWIRGKIRARRLVPGQRLVEVDIIRQTGGSRPKVREALQRLETEGLVTIEEFRGASVRNASMEEVRQIYRARAALEGICAADFTRRASAEEKERLAALSEALETCVEEGASERFGRLNAEWHDTVMTGSGNDVIRGLIQRLNTPIHHLVFETFYSAKRLRDAAADHRRILEAILADDVEGAHAAMRDHVENGLNFLRSLDKEVHFGDALSPE